MKRRTVFLLLLLIVTLLVIVLLIVSPRTDVHFEVEPQSTDGGYGAVTFGPDGRLLAATHSEGLTVWDIDTGEEVFRFAGDIGPDASFSPDGRKIAVPDGWNTVSVLDLATGEVLTRLVGHSDGVYSVSFSPDGHHILTAGTDLTIRIWDADSGIETQRLTGHSCDTSGSLCALRASYSPNGELIVSAGPDKLVVVWDAETGDRLLQLRGHTQYIQSASFSPDGGRIVTGAFDGTVRIWNVDTGQEMLRMGGRGFGFWQEALFTPDGRYVTAVNWQGSEALFVWDAKTGELLWNPTIYGVGPKWGRIALSPDGKHLAVTGEDGLVVLTMNLD